MYVWMNNIWYIAVLIVITKVNKNIEIQENDRYIRFSRKDSRLFHIGL